jgi:membrane protein
MTAPDGTASDDKPGLLDRLRARMPWFDHVMRAQQRYNDSKGDFYAAGITYFTIFALFPLLMVGFSIAGFVLVSQPQLLGELENKVRSMISGDMGSQLVELMDSAIESRGTVGIIGLVTAAWAGLGWMANLREALSQMWGLFRDEPDGFLKTKMSDLLALLSTFVAIVLTVVLSALGHSSVMADVLDWLGFPDSPVLGVVLRVASIAVSIAVSWLLFTWMIARLPRESASFRSSVRAGLLAAVAFEIFKLVASIYLKSVLTGPAGATFGPVLGLMVFAYITARLILFSTAWAATTAENMAEDPVPAPEPALIRGRIVTRPGLTPWQAGAAAAAGAFGALSVSRWRKR